jgi:hypothetical protein
VRIRLMGSIITLAAALFLSATVFAQTAEQTGTAKDQRAPDLTGVWIIDHFQPGLFPKGNAPFTPWGEAQFRHANTSVNDPNLACLPHGIPRLMFVPLPMEIFQVPGKVLMYQEAGNQLRQIHMDRQHPKEFDTLTYNGDSIGKWDGDALVVDTIGFNDITWLDHVGLPHSEALHVVERIRRMDHDTLQDDFTIEDAKAFTKPWKAQQIYKLKPGWEIAEYVCDNNKYVYHAPK